MGLAKRVTTGDERNRLFVVHCHPGEDLPDIPGRRDRIRDTIRTLRIDVNQAHLHSSERIFELPIAGIPFVTQPLVLCTPVDALIRLPGIFTAAGEAEGPESHRLKGDVAGKNQEVGPRDFAAILLLDRPEQPACFIEVRVIGPAVEGRETLLCGAGAATAITNAVRAGAMPCHADE